MKTLSQSRLSAAFTLAVALAACAPLEQQPARAAGQPAVLGLGTVVYQVRDLARAKAWYAGAFGVAPYFDEPFYVGFNIHGYELGLSPDEAPGPGPGGSVAFWRVSDIDEAMQRFLARGARELSPIEDVGGGIRVATVADPDGNTIGLIENPGFEIGH
jgi:predicted enzyme related to lactoylglutathione lyase